MLGLGLTVKKGGVSNYDAPRNFEIGTAPTVVLAASGTGDEAREIRPLNFFEYDADTWGLLYAAKSTTAASTRVFKYATALKAGFNHSWTKQGVVLTGGVGDWDENLGGATLEKDGSKWILLYCSITEGKIGVATGTVLGSLTKSVNNPVIDNTLSSGFNKYLRHPIATIEGSTLYCHYEGRATSANQIINSKIGYATAALTDLDSWTISDTVLIEPSDISYASGQNNSVANANKVKIGSYYYMWFQGYPPQDSAGEFEFGGTSYAYATDLGGPWTIKGTENYHIPMGLFGYNSSTEYFHTCQEVTPVFASGVLSIYMWDDQSSNIGKIDLNGGTFVNSFRGFVASDNFNDNSIDVSTWTTQNGNGITISETGGKMVVDCNGAADDTTFTPWITSNDSLNSDDGNVICCFNLERTTPTTGDFYGVELSNSALGNDNVIRFARDTVAGQIRIVIRENNSTITQNAYSYSGNETFKITISKRNRYDIYRGDGANFDHIEGAVISGFENTDWTFRLKAVNSIGAGQTISLDNWAFGHYDSGKVATFQT